METATFAGGCFWALEEVFREAPGVLQTEVGYMGGHVPAPTHAQVRSGTTGHAEVVNIEFDPGQVGYDDLLRMFFSSHDPTQLNRQGPDIGPEFRSAVFYHSAEQCQAADSVRAVLRQMKRSRQPIMTELVPASAFYPADEMHQHFLAKERARNRPWYPPVAEALAHAGGPRKIRTK
jgi:peptide-methionine (S)-S-oxide reductase